MIVSIVVAVARNGVIGADGDLAWRISDDLKWFKKNTLGKPVIMGRKTYDSIGRALPGRDNIVITRTPGFCAKGVFIARSISDAIALGKACAAARGSEEVCIIGGGQIYARTLARADRLYLTRVDAEIQGDTVFPEIDERVWTIENHGGCEKSEKNQYSCEFLIYQRNFATF